MAVVMTAVAMSLVVAVAPVLVMVLPGTVRGVLVSLLPGWMGIVIVSVSGMVGVVAHRGVPSVRRVLQPAPRYTPGGYGVMPGVTLAA